MDTLSLQNPLFATYVIAAAAMILKAASMSWLTVVRMLQVLTVQRVEQSQPVVRLGKSRGSDGTHQKPS